MKNTSTHQIGKPDVIVTDHGSIILFRPCNDEARIWLTEHTDGQWFGGALACERRHAEGLTLGLESDGGLTVGT